MENKELILNEMEKVNGGTQIADDSQFLNELGGYSDRYGSFKTVMSHDPTDDVIRGWSKVGVDYKISNVFDPNHYYINGKRVSREEAMAHARKVHAERNP